MIKSTVGIAKISPSKLEEFTNSLNVNDFWKEIAGKILTRDKSKYRFRITDIETFSRDKNPAKSMLLSWATDNAKIKDLVDLCFQLKLNHYVAFFKEFVLFDEKQNSIYSFEMSYKILSTWTNNFSSANMIGMGGFSSVYKAFDTEINKIYAVKKLHPDMNGIEQLKNELLIVSKCKHKNLMEIIGYAVEHNIYCIVYVYASNGSLDHQLFYRGVDLNYNRRVNIINDVANGLAYIHSNNFIHRDVKPANILLDDAFVAKLSDYGLARSMKNTSIETNTTSCAGTGAYMAPEAIYDGRLSGKTDVYSFGVVILEIVTGIRSVDNDRVEPVLIDHVLITCKSDLSIIKDSRVDWNYDALEMLFNMCLQCLKTKDIERPSMNDIVKIVTKFVS